MKRRLIVFMAVIFGITSTSFGSEIQCLVSGNPTSTQYVDATVNLKILLVQFTDIQCKKVSWNTAKYTRDDYEDMFGSQDEYVSPSKYTPDGDAVYGSMNDYFRFMSSGNIVIGASLINNLKPGTIYPVWVTLPHSKAYYHSTPYYDQTLITDAVVAATAAGLTIGTLNDFNKLVIIYAGNRYNGGGLNPYANTIGGTTYIMSELENSPMDQEHDNAKFARIATHCHEFAHTLGIVHSSGSRADIMEAGNRNGNWAAPAPLNPIARAEKGWISTIPITGQPEFDMHYSLTVPQVFRVNGNYSGEYFLFEMRKFDQNMTIGSVSVPDYNNSYFMPIAHSSNLTDVIETQGILVWRVKSFYPAGNYESSGLIYASGLYGMTYPDRIASETDAGDLFPGTANVKVISPWSDSRDPYMTSGGAPNNVFVPNTGRSTNVAMEVLSEQSSGFRIKLFATNPQDASPSKPQNVVAQYNTSNQAVITWNANQEPDVISGGGYNIYREIYYGSTVVSSTQLNSSLLTTTTYTDIDNYLISDVPVGVDLYCRYAVEAVDNTSKVSTKSIFGNIYLGKTVAGSISSNTTWGGSYVMVGDVTINSGTTLTINAGTTIRSSGEIIPGDEETQYNVYNTNVAGKILVNGTATQPVTFCPINGNVPGSWGSLLIYGTGANSSIIDHAIFNNGNLIQVQGASNVTVQNCAISNSLDIALDFSGATNCSALRNTVVNSNAGHGIVMENVSSVTCNQNTIYKSDHNYNGVGIYYGGGSNGNCWQNDIAYYGWGIGAIWGSSPHFFSMENDLRNNRITNCSRGVMIYYDSYPLVGEPYDQYSGNSIFGNGKNISLNYYYSTVSSIGGLDIYWGAVDPYSTFELGTGSHVLLYGVLPLPYDPWDGIDPLYLIKGAQETAQGDQTMQLNKSMNVAVDNSSMALASDAPIIKDIPSEPSLNPLSEGTALLVKGRIIEAKDYFLSYLKKHPNNLEAAARLYNCYSDATAEEIVDYFEKTGSSVEKDNKMMLSYLYLKRGHVDKAKALNSAIIAENPHTPLASNAALSNFYITLYNEKNPMGAGTILNEIESDNAFTTTVELPLARKALKLHSKYASISKSLKKSSKVLMDIPTEFSISQNYPNPFNPSTTISYTLPQASMVTLKVYDMLGREISTLVSEYKSQGRHDVSFNASQLSSGMYIYRIQAGSYIATKKMQLLK